VQPPGLGPDVAKVVEAVASPLRGNKNLIFLTNPNDLLYTCKESLSGNSGCFAAVVFNDSPLTIGKSGIWNNTIRTDSALSGGAFYANQHNNDSERIYHPLQVTVDNAITNSSIIPSEYTFGLISQATQNDNTRKVYQGLIISTFGIAFLIGLVSARSIIW
jgi:ATP-binding cassette, subfamily A (ABC1), member 3